ncbi:MAG TPA: tetratricopeptide repeat protein [Gemmatimonadaceae bacterium]|nr:tetratricopeptide repeat protein [Gemmatimonadaceae bacterium]
MTSTLRHQIFFDALTGLDANREEYVTIAAGLVTLRLLDTYTGPSLLAHNVDPDHALAVRGYVARDKVRPTIAGVLESVLDALQHTDVGRARAVTPRLLIYARALEYEGRWELAADVYQTALELVSDAEDAELLSTMHRDLGTCLRVIARFDEAADEYRVALAIARQAGDVEGELWVQHAQAALALQMGDGTGAERRLLALQRKARAYRLSGLEAMVMLEMATLHHSRGEFARAACHVHAVLDRLPTPVARDRALADLATDLCELGYRGAARDAQLLAATTAHEWHVRQHALINLMELAAIDGDLAAFDDYYRQLDGVRILPRSEAYYLLYAARGMRAFGRYKAAEVLLQRGMDHVERHHLEAFSPEFEAEAQALARREPLAPAPAPPEMTPEIAAIASDLRARRDMAGVGA